jgi:adenylylsulfate kinase
MTKALIKAITWRVIATVTTVVIVFGITGRWDVASAVGMLEVVVKTVLYIVHEHVWGDT